MPAHAWKPVEHASWMIGTQCHGNHSTGSVLAVTFNGRSGLNDRQFTFQRLGNIAGALGARIALPRPCKTLVPSHNHGVLMSCDVLWSRYLDVVFLDGTDALVDLHMPGLQQQLDRQYWDKVLHSLDAAHTSQFIDRTQGTVARRYDLAIHARHPFVWHVNDVDLEELAKLAESRNVSMRYKTRRLCSYVTQRPSVTVRTLAAAFASKHHLRTHHYVSMHIRRKDAAAVCDSNPRAAARYVRCSAMALANSSSFPSAMPRSLRVPLLIFTDETNKTYLSALTSALEAVASSLHPSLHPSLKLSPVVMAETWMAKVAANLGLPDDNYLRFAAGRMVKEAGLQLLEMNRHHCGKCGLFSRPEFRSDFHPF